MQTLLKLEEAALFVVSILLFTHLQLSWWWFAAFILLPDVGMLGYLINSKAGAFSYNLLHHKGIAIAIGGAGFALHNLPLEFAGLILFAHACMDRMMGYGLKYEKGFRYTHLGEVGKRANV